MISVRNFFIIDFWVIELQNTALIEGAAFEKLFV